MNVAVTVVPTFPISLLRILGRGKQDILFIISSSSVAITGSLLRLLDLLYIHERYNTVRCLSECSIFVFLQFLGRAEGNASPLSELLTVYFNYITLLYPLNVVARQNIGQYFPNKKIMFSL